MWFQTTNHVSNRIYVRNSWEDTGTATAFFRKEAQISFRDEQPLVGKLQPNAETTTKK